MIINTKYAIGEQVMFKCGPNEIETPGVVARISATVSKYGKVNVEYWVVMAVVWVIGSRKKDYTNERIAQYSFPGPRNRKYVRIPWRWNLPTRYALQD